MASQSHSEKQSPERNTEPPSVSEKAVGSNAQAQENMFEGVSAPGTDHRELLSLLRDCIADAQQVFSTGLGTASRVLLEPSAWTQEAAQAGPDLAIHLNNSKSWSSLVQGTASAAKAVGAPSLAVDLSKTVVYAGQALDKAWASARDASKGLNSLQGLDLLSAELNKVCREARAGATRLESFQRVALTTEQYVELSQILGLLVSDWSAARSIASAQVSAWALEMLSGGACSSPTLIVDLSATRAVPVGDLESRGDTMPWQAWVKERPDLQGQIMSAHPEMTIADWRAQGWAVEYQTQGLDAADAADRILFTTTREGDLKLATFLVRK